MSLSQWVYRFGVFGAVGLMASSAWGETAPAPATGSTAAPAASTAAVVPAPAASSLMGAVEVRPSYNITDEAFRTENFAEIGYRFSPNVNVRYAQSFTTNLSDPKLSPEASGLNAKIDRGFIRTQINNILRSEANGTSLSYENRLYLPTAEYDRQQNVAVILRNYVKFKKTFSPVFSLSLMDLPILQLNTKPGYVGAKGPVANAVFQNRVYVVPSINFTSKLSLAVPLMFHQTRYADFQAGAARNASWDFTLWTYPELTYAVNPNLYVGAAYYSGNLVKSDLSELQISKGLETGVAQLVLGATL